MSPTNQHWTMVLSNADQLSVKPHIVLVPGAWHDGHAFDRLGSLLESEGYEVSALTLPSVGAEPPVTSLDPDIACIRAKLMSLLNQDKEIVFVMHSYGGVAGASALRDLSKQDRSQQGLSGGVTRLVYICAWMISEGESVRSAGGGRGGKGGTKRVREEGDYLYHLDPIGAFYNDLPLEEAQKHAAKLQHHSLPTLTATTMYAAHKHIPSTYLVCTNDDTIPHGRQLRLIEDAGVPISVMTCNAGHSPFLSQPELTARVIRCAAGEEIVV